MGKLTTYIIVMSGIMLLFYFGGLIDATPNSTFLNLLLSPEKIQTLTLYEKGILVLEGIGAAAIITLGILTRNIELAVMGPFAIYYFNLGWDFLAVFNKVRSVNPVIAILFFSPMMILYVITILEWWRGRD